MPSLYRGGACKFGRRSKEKFWSNGMIERSRNRYSAGKGRRLACFSGFLERGAGQGRSCCSRCVFRAGSSNVRNEERGRWVVWSRNPLIDSSEDKKRFSGDKGLSDGIGVVLRGYVRTQWRSSRQVVCMGHRPQGDDARSGQTARRCSRCCL